MLVLGEARLTPVLKEYVVYFNGERPHQGPGQRIPDALEEESRRSGLIEERAPRTADCTTHNRRAA